MSQLAHIVSVAISNEPGALAKVAGALGSKGINIDGLNVIGRGNKGEAHFLVRDGHKAVEALQSEGFSGEVRDVYVVEVVNQAGALADACTRLASAGVNIEEIFGTTLGNRGNIALIVDDTEMARKVMGQ